MELKKLLMFPGCYMYTYNGNHPFKFNKPNLKMEKNCKQVL